MAASLFSQAFGGFLAAAVFTSHAAPGPITGRLVRAAAACLALTCAAAWVAA